jgi:hypothetical protein
MVTATDNTRKRRKDILRRQMDSENRLRLRMQSLAKKNILGEDSVQETLYQI